MSMILREGATSKRIDVVFDVYRSRNVDKEHREREERGYTGIEYRNIQPDHRIQQWRKFLSNPQNKKQLVRVVTEEWQKERSRQRLTGKHLFTATEESCVEISADNFRPREDLTSTQEEADTRLLLHASHAARNGFKAIVISSEDTDVFVLCLAFKDFVPATMYLKCGTQTRTRFVSITNVFERHGSRICKCLPGLHAFTGCDSVSAFSGKGKLTALKLVKRRPAYQELFQQLGVEWELSNELFVRLQEFTCLMYSSNPGTRDVNVLRYRLFCARKGELESHQLPPCQDTLRKHCERANYQSAIWRRSLQCSPQIPSPIGSGWCLKDGKLTIDWMNGEPAPKAVLELLSCQCKRVCQLPSCTCLANGLHCTDMCRLRECTNQPEEAAEDLTTDDSDIECEDD